MKPVLILIDIQKEYTTKNRPFYLNGIEPSLNNCKNILQMARNKAWQIVHIMHEKEGGSLFATNSEYTEFADDFKPAEGEHVFKKSLYSCYSSAAYGQFMKENLDNQIYIIGYNSIMCCLSTIIEGYHKGQKIIFIADASLAKSTAEYSEQDMHQHSVSMIKAAGFADVIQTSHLLQE